MAEGNEDDIDQGGQSSSLRYLHDESINQTSRKRPAHDEKQSEIRKVYINNRGRDKKVDTDSIYAGIYLYKPGVELPSLYNFSNQTIRIIIASEYIKRDNPQYIRRNLYGNDSYTSNSDAVCMLVHSGCVNLNTFSSKRYEGVQLTCKVIKPKKNYTGSSKNGLISRSLKGYNGNALKPECARNLVSLGDMELLQKYASNMHIPIGKTRVKSKPKNISAFVPIPETHLVFNMNDQPAYKYSLFNIADKGFERNEFMVKKLDNYVLYLETEQREKYEILKKCSMNVFDIYQLSKLKYPDRCDNYYFQQNKSPLSEDMIDVLQASLEWEDIVWANTAVIIKKDLRIERVLSFKYYRKQREDK